MVRAGKDVYPVVFSNYRQELTKHLKDANQIVVISNPTIYALFGEMLHRNILPRRVESVPLLIGDGERYKSRRTIEQLYDHFLDIGVSRTDAIIAFGGGVVGDTAGFAAATFKRGVPWIQIPTTLLAMVDASIGGKVAVNHRLGKNLIGAFHQPQAVIINPDWLATLGYREMTEGMAEIIKAGLLSSKKLLNRAATTEPVYSTAAADALASLIREAITFKARVIAQDVFDRDRRMILNFGHTFAHAIEKAEGFRWYRHGEAVLAGMAGALYLSYTTGYLPRGRMEECVRFLAPFVGRLRPLKKRIEDYVSPMTVDKKGKNGRLVFILLKGIGQPATREVRSLAKVSDSVEFMKHFVNNRGKS